MREPTKKHLYSLTYYSPGFSWLPFHPVRDLKDKKCSLIHEYYLKWIRIYDIRCKVFYTAANNDYKADCLSDSLKPCASKFKRGKCAISLGFSQYRHNCVLFIIGHAKVSLFCLARFSGPPGARHMLGDSPSDKRRLSFENEIGTDRSVKRSWW